MSIYINLIYFLPMITGGERSKYCTMKTALSMGLFAWVLTCPFILVHLAYCICFVIKDKSRGRTTQELKNFVAIAAQYVAKLNEIAYFVGWAVYFYVS